MNTDATPTAQSRQSRASLVRQLVISGVIVAGFAAGGLALSRNGRRHESAPASPASTTTVRLTAEGAKAADIEVQAVRLESTPGDIHSTGQILYSPDLTVKVSPRLAGRVRQVFARVGDRVTAGQSLAVIDSVDAATARTTDMQNQNVLRQARVNLERTERLFRLGTPEVTQAMATLAQSRTGEESAKDVLDKTTLQAKIGGFTQKPLEDAQNALVSAKSALSQAQSDLIMAQKDFDRKTQLVAIGVAAKADLETSTDTLDKARVNVDAGKENVRLAQEAVDREQKAYRSNLYADQQVNQARFNYQQAVLQRQAAERSLLLARAAIRTALDQARTDLRAAEYNAENSRQALYLLGQPGPDGTLAIKAPISGVVTERFVAPGQVVDQSQMTPWQMFTLASTDRVWVEAAVYEKDLAAVREGLPVRIRVGAVPGVDFTGRVLHIAPSLDKTSRAIKVRAEIDNRADRLKDGMYADVDILMPAGRPSLVVPLSAIVHGEDSDFVYLEQKGQYVQRGVTVTAQRENQAVIGSGLQPGDRIVTHGALLLGTEVSGD